MLPVDAVDDGAGEDFAVGEVLVAVAVDPLHAGHAEPHVGAVGGHDVVVAAAGAGFFIEQVGQPLLLLLTACQAATGSG